MNVEFVEFKLVPGVIRLTAEMQAEADELWCKLLDPQDLNEALLSVRAEKLVCEARERALIHWACRVVAKGF